MRGARSRSEAIRGGGCAGRHGGSRRAARPHLSACAGFQAVNQRTTRPLCEVFEHVDEVADDGDGDVPRVASALIASICCRLPSTRAAQVPLAGGVAAFRFVKPRGDDRGDVAGDRGGQPLSRSMRPAGTLPAGVLAGSGDDLSRGARGGGLRGSVHIGDLDTAGGSAPGRGYPVPPAPRGSAPQRPARPATTRSPRSGAAPPRIPRRSRQPPPWQSGREQGMTSMCRQATMPWSLLARSAGMSSHRSTRSFPASTASTPTGQELPDPLHPGREPSRCVHPPAATRSRRRRSGCPRGR
jgi:hypothetical protein